MANLGSRLRKERGAMLAVRVNDVMYDMGHGDKESGRRRFLEHTIWTGRQAGLRLWKDQGTVQGNIMVANGSLKVLLGERKPGTSGKTPITNENWVLDLWEVACDDWNRVKPAKPESLPSPNDGAVPVVLSRPLSTRMLEAYVQRNDGAILTTLAELEALGL